MHDPSVVVFDIPVPVPSLRWRAPSLRRGLSRVRSHVGNPMYSWWRPRAWQLALGDRRIGWTDVVCVWHEEPDGHDSGTVCKGMGSSELTWHNVKWAWKHRSHLTYQWYQVQSARIWLFARCSECGKPFRGDYRSRHGYMDSGEVMHDHCMRIKSLEREADSMAEVIMNGTDDWSVSYHAANRLGRKKEREAASGK